MANIKAEPKVFDSPNLDALGDLTIVTATEKKGEKPKVEADRLVRKNRALNGISKLLTMSEKFSSYCDKKLSDSLHESEKGRLKAMVDNNSNNNGTKKSILSKLSLFKGKLHDYQVEGVRWLKALFEVGLNGILADEMGLGKTIQVIALLCHILELEIKGPFLIVVPLSTLPNWTAEFKRFAPSIPVVKFHGDRDTRQKLMYDIFKTYEINGEKVRPVVLTTIHMVSKELNMFRKVVWKYMIMDEAHSLKNHLTKVSTEMRSLQCLNKVLLTGTPLQNNLEELWSLLNFIMPSIFKNSDTFSSLIILEDLKDEDKIVQEERSNKVISSMHKVLEPFMLRRLKIEVLGDIVPKKEVLVYCPLTKLQRHLYSFVLEKNLGGLHGDEEVQEEIGLEQPKKRRRCAVDVSYKKWSMDDYEYADSTPVESPVKRQTRKSTQFTAVESKQDYVVKISSMANPVMMFKKIVNHPFLVHIPVTPDGTDVVLDERVVSESGKMLVLDAMLTKLKQQNHRVLIFSTLVMMLDLIEEYVEMKHYKFCRLDGSMSLDDRQKVIEQFNKDPDIFLFLISTRAGGLGVNLTAADTVILYDRDWNPQVDLQAQDRCHRIGQTKPVMVFSLVTRNTIDETIVERATIKRRLEKVIIKNGKFRIGGNKNIDLKELRDMLNSDTSTDKIPANGKIYSDKELEKLLDRSELYKEMEEKMENNKENASC